MSVVFDEIVGGFFGFGRTSGAVARIETDSAATLKRDWLEALDEMGDWRAEQGERARAISVYFLVPHSIVNETRSFVGDTLIAPAKLPKELEGLVVNAVVFDPDGGIPFEATIRPA